jgi:hypothetical protein
MKFTVLIPLYNKAPYIRCTLESVLAQNFRDYEILVIDDGSTDGGDLIVEGMAGGTVRLIRQANAGVSAARNRGISEARGDWVSFLDADDWQHPEFLSALVLAQVAFPEARTVGTDFLRFPHTEGSWPPHWSIPASPHDIECITDLPARWMHAPSLCSSAVAARRDLLQSMQPCFPLGETVGEDLDLWFRLAEKSPIALVRVPLAAYRLSVAGSLTTQHTHLTSPPWIQRIRERAMSDLMTPAQRRSALWLVAQHEVSVARCALVVGQRLSGLRWLIRGRHAARGRRWWLTLAMTLFMPNGLVSHWEAWRIRRSSPFAQMTN